MFHQSTIHLWLFNQRTIHLGLFPQRTIHWHIEKWSTCWSDAWNTSTWYSRPSHPDIPISWRTICAKPEKLGLVKNSQRRSRPLSHLQILRHRGRCRICTKRRWRGNWSNLPLLSRLTKCLSIEMSKNEIFYVLIVMKWLSLEMPQFFQTNSLKSRAVFRTEFALQK